MWWVADIFANLRVQQITALLVILVGAVGLRKWRWSIVLLILIGIHLPFFASVARSPKHSLETTADSKSSRILLANVLTSNSRHDEIIRQIRDRNPDVFAILELSTPLADTLERGLAGTYSFHVSRPMDRGNFGIGVYSKHPLEQIQVFTLDDTIESITAVVGQGESTYRIVATHPLPPMSSVGFKRRNQHLFNLAGRIDRMRLEDPEVPIIVLGDLNLTPWSPIFYDFETQSGLTRASSRFDLSPTWYAKNHFLFGLILDHALLSDGLECLSHHVGADFGSDHRAVTIEIQAVESAD